MKNLKIYLTVIVLLILTTTNVWSQNNNYFIPCSQNTLTKYIGNLPKAKDKVVCAAATGSSVSETYFQMPNPPQLNVPSPDWVKNYHPGGGNAYHLRLDFSGDTTNYPNHKALKVIAYRSRKEGGIFDFDCTYNIYDPWHSFTVTREHPTNNPGARLVGPSEGEVIKGRDLVFNWFTNQLSSIRKVELYFEGEYVLTDYSNRGANPPSGIISIPTDTITPDTGYVFVGKFVNSCGTVFYDTTYVDVLGTCAGDLPADMIVEGNGVEEILEGYPDGGYKIEPGISSFISIHNITDIGENYTVSHNGDTNEIALDKFLSDSLYVLTSYSEFGSFRVEVIRDTVNAQGCLDIYPLKIFVKGSDAEINDECSIVLPDYLDDHIQDPNVFKDYIITDFNVKVTSGKNIVVKPGVKLVRGAQLHLDPQELYPVEADTNRNFTQRLTYDDYGRITSGSRGYFDERGRPVQLQAADLTTDHILVTQTLYDHYDRPALTTLPAPHTVSSGIDKCGDPVDISGYIPFAYHEHFMQNSVTGDPYQESDFESLDSLGNIIAGNPVALLDTAEGTLGWYYSDNNNLESYVPTSKYPFSATEYHTDASSDIKSKVPPGNIYRDSTGHKFVSVAERQKVDTSDMEIITWLNIRNNEVFPADTSAPSHLATKAYKIVSSDANGKQSVLYRDKNGNIIITCSLGDDSSSTKICSYNFYNDRNWLMASVTPNGIIAYNDSIPYDSIDKTTYKYNHRGWLLAVNEPDAGRTEYKYRRDGSLRFSQNALQRDSGRYSYTNYDRTGRPVESGEYDPEGNGIVFDSISTNILESIALDGGLTGGAKSGVVKMYYDRVDPNAPIEQTFVRGGISRTEKAGVSKTWYSYDERGRVIQTAQYIEGLDETKTVDYIYNAAGYIQEVAYQRGETDQFFHFYQYDKDQRLKKVYTSAVIAPVYEQKEITNLASLDKQAEYFYYIHGSLKRVELADTLQGIDYVYTIEGWLKSINHPKYALDPGQDSASSFVPDVFGMTLEYYNGDYLRDSTGIESIALEDTVYTPGYGGNIRGMAMRTGKPDVATGYSEDPTMYTFTYDDRYQITSATWGSPDFTQNTFTGSGTAAFKVDSLAYDANGNILGLLRNDRDGSGLHNFVNKYQYASNKNQLTEITNYASYTYNNIGQMTSEDLVTGMDKYMNYDVGGMVTEVSDSANARVRFTYDENGMRLSKTILDSEGDSVMTTWYVRSSDGQLMAVYEEDHLGSAGLYRKEVPIYGLNRLGLWLDNVGFSEATFLATMEDSLASEEEQYFMNLDSCRVPVPDFLNHTGPYNGGAMRLNNYKEGNSYTLGAAIALSVRPGDTIHTEVFAKYVDHDYNDQYEDLGDVINFNDNVVGSGPVSEGGGFAGGSFLGGLLNLLTVDGEDDSIPAAYLNYVLFDKNLEFVDAGYKSISGNARVPVTGYGGHSFEEMEINNIAVEKAGYIYVYVSSESQIDADIYFDDISVTHITSETYQYQITDHLGNVRAVIESGAGEPSLFRDYYPFGGELQSWSDGLTYRYQYQGNYAEYDTITRLSTFEARMYNATVGRWIGVDPARQFASPYLAMGNSPMTTVDPDGELAWFVPVIIGAAVGAEIGGWASSGTPAFWKWEGQDWTAAGIGSIAGAGAGLGVSAALSTASIGGKLGVTITKIYPEIVSATGNVAITSHATLPAWNIVSNALITANVNMLSSAMPFQERDLNQIFYSGLVGLVAGGVGGGIGGGVDGPIGPNQDFLSQAGIRTTNYVTAGVNGFGDRFINSLYEGESFKQALINGAFGVGEGLYFAHYLGNNNAIVNLGGRFGRNPIPFSRLGGRYISSILTQAGTSVPGLGLTAASWHASIVSGMFTVEVLTGLSLPTAINGTNAAITTTGGYFYPRYAQSLVDEDEFGWYTSPKFLPPFFAPK